MRAIVSDVRKEDPSISALDAHFGKIYDYNTHGQYGAAFTEDWAAGLDLLLRPNNASILPSELIFPIGNFC